MHEIPTPSRERMSRRDFLRAASLIPPALILAGCVESSVQTKDEGVHRSATLEPLPFSDDIEIARIEQRRQIRLINSEQAYELLGLDFDASQVRGEDGERPPNTWDHERAHMLDGQLEVLPEFFYRKASNGETLHIALVDSSDSGLEGKYVEDANQMGNPESMRGADLILLDRDYYAPNLAKISMQTITHELIHRGQYEAGEFERRTALLESTLGMTVEKIMRRTLNELTKEEQNIWENSLFLEFSDALKYGVVFTDEQGNTFEDENGQIIVRDKIWEYEAVLGQIYLFGEKAFYKFFKYIYGSVKSKLLYAYVQNNIFGGVSYEEFPTDYLGKQFDMQIVENL